MVKQCHIEDVTGTDAARNSAADTLDVAYTESNASDVSNEDQINIAWENLSEDFKDFPRPYVDGRTRPRLDCGKFLWAVEIRNLKPQRLPSEVFEDIKSRNERENRLAGTSREVMVLEDEIFAELDHNGNGVLYIPYCLGWYPYGPNSLYQKRARMQLRRKAYTEPYKKDFVTVLDGHGCHKVPVKPGTVIHHPAEFEWLEWDQYGTMYMRYTIKPRLAEWQLLDPSPFSDEAAAVTASAENETTVESATDSDENEPAVETATVDAESDDSSDLTPLAATLESLAVTGGLAYGLTKRGRRERLERSQRWSADEDPEPDTKPSVATSEESIAASSVRPASDIAPTRSSSEKAIPASYARQTGNSTSAKRPSEGPGTAAHTSPTDKTPSSKGSDEKPSTEKSSTVDRSGQKKGMKKIDDIAKRELRNKYGYVTEDYRSLPKTVVNFQISSGDHLLATKVANGKLCVPPSEVIAMLKQYVECGGKIVTVHEDEIYASIGENGCGTLYIPYTVTIAKRRW